MNMLTKTPPTKERSRKKGTRTGSDTVQPARTRGTSSHVQKVGLLVILCAALAIIFLLHTAMSHIAGPAPTATTCSDLVSSADYTQAVDFQPVSQQMAAVQMVNDLAGGQPAALVEVSTPNQQNALDIYIFGCSLEHQQPHLRKLFSQQGLAQGSAELTPTHTLITTALDTGLSPNDIPLLQPLQQNIYHEYAWRDGQFVQVLFPGFYPVTSRVEAQALQQNFNNGQQLPWHDPLATAQQMAKDLLHWSSTPSTRLVSQTSDTAQVELASQSPRVALEVTLRRLIQPDNNGLWFVTDARTRGMQLTRAGSTSEPFPQTTDSPIHFSGANALIDGHTSATLFDHTLTPVPQATSVPVSVQPDSTCSGTLTYPGGLRGQQGVILIESLPQTKNQEKEPGQLVLTSVILG